MPEDNAALEKHNITIFPDGRMKTDDAAKYLGLSPKTLATMRCRGTGPKFVRRGRIFYFLEDLKSWIGESDRVSSTAEYKKQVPLCGPRR
jgi:hypothetical protein